MTRPAAGLRCDFAVRLDDDGVSSVDDLRGRIARSMQDWSAFHDLMAVGHLLRPGV